MAFRNPSKLPGSSKAHLPVRSPSTKKDGGGGGGPESPLGKRGRIGVGVGRNLGRTRQVFSVMNVSEAATRDDPTSNASSECGPIEFNKEVVEALMNEKMKGKNTSGFKAKEQYMAGYIKRLKLCIKWYREMEESYVLEQGKLRESVEGLEKKCTETEEQMRNKTYELDTIIAELRRDCASLEEKLANVELEKMAAIDSHNSEKEARLAVERARASLDEDLQKAQQELRNANQKIESLNFTYMTSQEYNTSLQQYNGRLQNDCDAYKKNLKRMEDERAAIVENLSTIRTQYNLLQNEVSSFQASRNEALKHKESLESEVGYLRAELQQVKDDRDRHQSFAQNLTAELEKFKEMTGKSFTETDNLRIRSNVLEETCSSQKEEIRLLQHQLEAANQKLKMADLTTVETRTEFEEQKKLVQNLQNRLEDAELELIKAEKLRKELHNTILELKGNIRVFCRVRPLLPDDGANTEAPVICYPSTSDTVEQGIDLVQIGQKHHFSFDKVFSHDSSQQAVFVEISQLVQSALDGYKVCIFAYGQTGSGKTYTMMGRPVVPEQKGLIPRSLEQIFHTSQSLLAQGWKYKMQASMLEIYNETIQDLLSSKAGGPDNGMAGKQYTIKHDASGNTHVSDLTIVDVSSLKEVSSLLSQAAHRRSVGKTQMNEQSSRSHFVFTLRISGINESTEQQVQGVLNLIDLAGSERLSKSGATGDRLRETQAINKSLSALSEVIASLANKEEHVPFRNSKLTYLLQPCLGGNSKTLMFVNISPDPSSVGESLCSLRFAARVNACEIGTARRQTTMRPTDLRLSS